MKILLAGDSTVAHCPSYEYPMSGWGAELAPLVYQWGAVHNLAKGGASTGSFRDEGLWGQLLELAGPGDVVLLQFGHNDQKLPHLAAGTGYTANLERMLEEVHAVGAQAVLCTSVERRNFIAGAQTPTLADYAQAVRGLSARRGVPLIDLNLWTTELYRNAGEAGSIAYFTHLGAGEHAHWPEGLADNTHFSRTGAAAVAGKVAEALQGLRSQPAQLG
ncbi:rhamnogalacturonan acetylesterase [Specibacter sp. NPDC057265]|uniref:rhamnogalacturonan acetylesterase n=1 Tax=Specibacter sp. NPDC057265 TaxID=3346075 RepID=UPI003631A0B5